MVIILFIVIYVIFYYFVTQSDMVNPGKSQQMRSLQSELQKNASLNTSETIETPPTVPDVTLIPMTAEPKSYRIKIDVSHGFYPDEITINRSDFIIWNDEENQRSRIILLSKDGLFENKIMQYQDKYKYQFNQQGKYTFNLAEHPENIEYDNATGTVIVN